MPYYPMWRSIVTPQNLVRNGEPQACPGLMCPDLLFNQVGGLPMNV